jgi:NADPH:quinone reductase-like Zn-dependent oxidoreductase
MKAAVVKEAGKSPVYGDFRDPSPAGDEVLIQVKAAALSHLARDRALGKHYSSTAELPMVPGIDGVGLIAGTMKRVFFAFPTAPFGSLAEKTVVKVSLCVPVPDGLDDVTAAALGNPGMSSWAAFKERAHLAAGETVLVNGATGAAGRLAVQIAKHLGAKKVIATGRDPEALQKLEAIGADSTISLMQPKEAQEAAFQQAFASGVDVVVDYLWGPTAELLIGAISRSGRGAKPVRYVELGNASEPNITLPGAALRSTALELMGSGLGSVPLERLVSAIGSVMQAAIPARLAVETEAYPLSRVEEGWAKESSRKRTVFVVG